MDRELTDAGVTTQIVTLDLSDDKKDVGLIIDIKKANGWELTHCVPIAAGVARAIFERKPLSACDATDPQARLAVESVRGIDPKRLTFKMIKMGQVQLYDVCLDGQRKFSSLTYNVAAGVAHAAGANLLDAADAAETKNVPVQQVPSPDAGR